MFPIARDRVPRRIVKSTDTRDTRLSRDSRMSSWSNAVNAGGEEWYHIHCVDVPKTALKDSKEPWFYNKC